MWLARRPRSRPTWTRPSEETFSAGCRSRPKARNPPAASRSRDPCRTSKTTERTEMHGSGSTCLAIPSAEAMGEPRWRRQLRQAERRSPPVRRSEHLPTRSRRMRSSAARTLAAHNQHQSDPRCAVYARRVMAVSAARLAKGARSRDGRGRQRLVCSDRNTQPPRLTPPHQLIDPVRLTATQT